MIRVAPETAGERTASRTASDSRIGDGGHGVDAGVDGRHGHVFCFRVDGRGLDVAVEARVANVGALLGRASLASPTGADVSSTEVSCEVVDESAVSDASGTTEGLRDASPQSLVHSP